MVPLHVKLKVTHSSTHAGYETENFRGLSMGARANYAIVEGGKVTVFYSHWGALTIVEDIYWGPGTTEAFIRRNEETAEWLDNVWAEGGIAFNKDECRLTYYATHWPDEPDLEHACDRLLEATWKGHGWTLNRATEWREIAVAVGLDPEAVTVRPEPEPIVALEDVHKKLAEGRNYGLIGLRSSDGWEDHVIEVSMAGLLRNGPAVIEWLPDGVGLDELRSFHERQPKGDDERSLGDRVVHCCAINAERRQVWLSLSIDDEDQTAWISDAWPGWQVIHERGGTTRYFIHTGRSVPGDLIPAMEQARMPSNGRPFDECVRLIREHIATTEERKLSTQAWSTSVIQKLAKEQGEGQLQIAKGLLDRVPSSKPTWIEKWGFRLRHFLHRGG